MKFKNLRSIFYISIFSFCFLIMASCEKKESQNRAVNYDSKIYNESADARQDIANAIERARQTGRNVLLMFGGNWCGWCHRLHQLLNENEEINKFLNSNYILVMVDVGKRDKNLDLNEKYGDPYSLGFPVLVILNSEGNQIHTQETGSLEYSKVESDKKGHHPERVLKFLKAWAPHDSNE